MAYLGEEIRKLGFGLMRLPQKELPEQVRVQVPLRVQELLRVQVRVLIPHRFQELLLHRPDSWLRPEKR